MLARFQTRPRSSYLLVVGGECDAQVGHGPEDGHQGLDGVAVHHGPVLLVVLGGEAGLVNNSADRIAN